MAEFVPRAVATRLLKDIYPHGTLRYWRQEFWLWTGNCYRTVSEDNLRGIVQDWLSENSFASRRSHVTEVLDQIKGLRRVMDTMDQPIFIDVEHYDTTYNWLSFRNGVIDLDDVIAGRNIILRRNTPEWFSPVTLDYDYDPQAECPLWTTVLQELCKSDLAMIDFLQEWFGYCFTRDTSFKSFVVLYGETNTGKSTISNVLETLVGPANRSAVPLELFHDRFSISDTIGKLVNFCGDADCIGTMAEGVIKRATGGDTLRIDRKYKDPVLAKMTAKIFVAANNLPAIRDSSDALWDRIIALPMRNRIPADKVDRSYLDPSSSSWPFRTELPGILNWALGGLSRLYRNGGFTKVQAAEQLRASLRQESSSAAYFLEQYSSYVRGHRVQCQDVLTKYASWCRRQGLTIEDPSAFGRAVARIRPEVERDRRAAGGVRPYYYIGLKIEGAD